MKHTLKLLTITAVLFPCLSCMGEEAVVLPDSPSANPDTAVSVQNAPSKHDTDARVLDNLYTELSDINSQIKDTHNWLVDLNFMSPGVERKIKQRIDGLNERLNKAASQLDSITDKEAKNRAKPYRVSVKDCRQKLNKCSSLLIKKSKK